MTRKLRLLIIVMSLLLIIGGIALAQSNNYHLSWWTVDNGGETLTTASGLTLHSTIGQPDASTVLVSDSGNHTLSGGFWGVALPTIENIPITLTVQSGYTNLKLNWNPTNDTDVVAYRVSRAISGTAQLTTTTTVSDTTYFDQDPALVSGTGYCYQIDALRVNSSVAQTSNLACAIAGQLRLWVPAVWSEPGGTAIPPGKTVAIPVNVENARGLQIAFADIWLEYDHAIITPVDITNTPLTNGYTWDHTIVTSTSGLDQVRISTSGGSNPPVLYGEGALFWLIVQVPGTAGDTSPLNLREFIIGEGGSAIYAPEDLTESIPLSLKNGTFHVEEGGPYRRGDLNGNGLVEAIDAYIVLEIATGKIIPKPEQLSAGDVNYDGNINSADASMILYYASHGNWPPFSSMSGLRVTSPDLITVSLDHINGAPGATVETTLRVADVSNWAGGDFVIVYDPRLISGITNVIVTGIASDFDLKYRDDSEGLLYISLAKGLPVTGDGPIVTISMTIATNAPIGRISPIPIALVKLNDNTGQDFVTSVLQKTILKQDGLLQVEETQKHIYLPLVLRQR